MTPGLDLADSETFMLGAIYDAFEQARYLYVNQRRTNIEFGSGTVSFTFDDFPTTAAKTGARLLEEHGWRGTFYLAPGLIEKDTALGRISSAEEVGRLHRRGHEIGSHTFSHLHCRNISGSTLLREYESSLQELQRWGGGRNFALPFGSYDASALNFLSGRFDTIRTVQAGINTGRADLNLLKANAIYQSTALEGLQSLIDQVKASRGWLIFYTHDVRPAPSQFGCTANRLRTVLRWVNDAGLAVRTIGETYASLSS